MQTTKFLKWAKEAKEDLQIKIMFLGSEDRFLFEKDYYIIASQYQLIESLIEMTLKGEFGED